MIYSMRYAVTAMILLCVMLSLPGMAQEMPTSVNAAPNAQNIEVLSAQIGKKESELLRLNTHFRIECTRVSKWKRWRIFLYNLGASSCSEAGITSIAATRWHYWRNPKLMPRSTATAGPICLLVGHCITLGGTLIEFGLDEINDHKVRAKGMDIKTTHKKALELKGELDSLLAQREAAVENAADLAPSERTTARAEGVVMRDVRDLELKEYGQFFVRANKFFAARDANTLAAITSASTGGFQGSLLGILSAHLRRPRLTGAGGLGFLESGATIVATPWLGRFSGNIRGHFAQKRIASEFGDLSGSTVAKLEHDQSALQLAAAQTTSGGNLPNVSRRLTGYVREIDLFKGQNELNGREKALANKEFVERALTAACIGGTKMSWGINLAHAGFAYHPKTIKKVTVVKGKKTITSMPDPGPSKQFTKRVAIGATTYIPGTSLWILDTLQRPIREEFRDRGLMAQSKLPAALLKERLDRVDEIDDSFNY